VAVLSLIVSVVWDFRAHALHQPAASYATVRATGGGVTYPETRSAQRFPYGGLNPQTGLSGKESPPRVDGRIKPPVPSGIWSTGWNWLHLHYGFWWVLIPAGGIVMGYVYTLAHRRATLQRKGVRWKQSDLPMRSSESGAAPVAGPMRHLNAAADHVAAQMESQKILLAYASHELRSPLARIRMALELAAQSETARQRARAEIVRDLDELDQIIGRTLLITQLEIKSDLCNHEQVDLIGLLAEECARANVTLNIAPNIAASTANGIMLGSLFLLRQAVRNLLENATQYGQRADKTSDNSVLLEYESAVNHAVLIHVDDCGPGVPLDQVECIFERFYALPGTGKRGLGLGLTLVRMIAERHGGSITYSNRAGGGARFTLRLPRQAAL
jgi:signal transduction histidine kinase